MTIIKIVREGLKSQVVRDLVGERFINLFEALNGDVATGNDQPPDRRGMWGLATRLTGFLSRLVVRGLQWLATDGLELLRDAVFELANFDWNQTDDELLRGINQEGLNLVAALGSSLGTGAAWMASIGLSAAVAVKFPVIGGKVAMEIAREGGEEIRGALRSFASQARISAIRASLLGSLLTARKLRLFGFSPQSQQKEPWTWAIGFENLIESIPIDSLRIFAENFFESFFEGLLEVTYVISYSIDDYYSSQRLALNNSFGEQRAVILTPDRRSEDENVILRGPQTLIQQNIQTALVSHQLVHNRDIGQIVGQPAGDWLRAGVQRRVLTITYRNKELPPWTLPNGERIKEITITIPDCRIGLNWRDIKAVCRPWTWGKFRATANLDNGRKLKVNGSSPVEAEQTLRRFATLQTAEILTLSVTEEKDRHPDLIKRPEQVWPSYGHLLVRRRVSGDSGLTELNGQNYQNDRIRFELWPNEEPEGLPLLT